MSPVLWQITQITQVTAGTMFDVAAVDAHRIYETEGLCFTVQGTGAPFQMMLLEKSSQAWDSSCGDADIQTCCITCIQQECGTIGLWERSWCKDNPLCLLQAFGVSQLCWRNEMLQRVTLLL